MEKNRKGAIGETITWLVATLIIIVILVIFVYVSSFIDFTKAINLGDIGIKIYSEKDRFAIKTSLAYSINNANKKEIDAWIKNAES